MESSLTICIPCRWGYETEPKHGEIVLSMDGADNIRIETPNGQVRVNGQDFLRAIKTMTTYQSAAAEQD